MQKVVLKDFMESKEGKKGCQIWMKGPKKKPASSSRRDKSMQSLAIVTQPALECSGHPVGNLREQEGRKLAAVTERAVVILQG